MGSGVIGKAVGDTFTINDIKNKFDPWNDVIETDYHRDYKVGEIVWNYCNEIGVITKIEGDLITLDGNAFKNIDCFDIVVTVLGKVEEK